MSDPIDALATERAAYLDASQASIDATLDAQLISAEPTTERLPELRAAVGLMLERQLAVIAAHDRLVTRAQELGTDPELVSQLREGRADLVLQLEATRRTQQQLSGTPHDGEA